MPKAKKLPSGSWRCRVFSHFEYVAQADGSVKKVQVNRSFTSKDPSPRGRKEAERMAAEWMYGSRLPDSGKTVKEAIASYIDAKEDVLSPSTLRSYRSNLRTAYGEIGHIELSGLAPSQVQRWVNNTAKKNTPKTTRNKYALLDAAYQMFTGEKLNATLPARVKPKLYTPSTEDVRKLLAFLSEKESRQPLLIAVMLAAFCSLRRSEICALTSDDLDGSVLHISKAIVEDSLHSLSVKQPKTFAGYRDVDVPPFLLDLIKDKEGRLVPLTPSALSDRFRRAVDSCFDKQIHFRFHDLRHYYVSFAHAIGIPDAYIRESGGWKTDYVMRRVYMDTLSDEKIKQSEKLQQMYEAITAGILAG